MGTGLSTNSHENLNLESDLKSIKWVPYLAVCFAAVCIALLLSFVFAFAVNITLSSVFSKLHLISENRIAFLNSCLYVVNQTYENIRPLVFGAYFSLVTTTYFKIFPKKINVFAWSAIVAMFIGLFLCFVNAEFLGKGDLRFNVLFDFVEEDAGPVTFQYLLGAVLAQVVLAKNGLIDNCANWAKGFFVSILSVYFFNCFLNVLPVTFGSNFHRTGVFGDALRICLFNLDERWLAWFVYALSGSLAAFASLILHNSKRISWSKIPIIVGALIILPILSRVTQLSVSSYDLSFNILIPYFLAYSVFCLFIPEYKNVLLQWLKKIPIFIFSLVVICLCTIILFGGFSFLTIGCVDEAHYYRRIVRIIALTCTSAIGCFLIILPFEKARGNIIGILLATICGAFILPLIYRVYPMDCLYLTVIAALLAIISVKNLSGILFSILSFFIANFLARFWFDLRYLLQPVYIIQYAYLTFISWFFAHHYSVLYPESSYANRQTWLKVLLVSVIISILTVSITVIPRVYSFFQNLVSGYYANSSLVVMWKLAFTAALVTFPVNIALSKYLSKKFGSGYEYIKLDVVPSVEEQGKTAGVDTYSRKHEFKFIKSISYILSIIIVLVLALGVFVLFLIMF